MGLTVEEIRAISEVLGKASAGANSSNQVRDQQNLQRYGLQENAKAAQDRFAAAAPGQRLGTSTRASLLSNFQPTTAQWGGPGSGLRGETVKYSGGASGGLANLDPGTKALAGRTIEDQLLAQMRGGLSGGGMDTKVQEAPVPGQSSALDKLLGGGATAAGILGALGKNGAGGQIDLGKLLGGIFHHGGNETPWSEDPWADFDGVTGYDPNDPNQSPIDFSDAYDPSGVQTGAGQDFSGLPGLPPVNGGYDDDWEYGDDNGDGWM